MKYVFVGTIAPKWLGRQAERVNACKAKGEELGMSFDAIHYTQGAYDFVDIVDASDPYVVLGFSLWYAKKGYGRITTMPAFDEAAMERAAEAI